MLPTKPLSDCLACILCHLLKLHLWTALIFNRWQHFRLFLSSTLGGLAFLSGSILFLLLISLPSLIRYLLQRELFFGLRTLILLLVSEGHLRFMHKFFQQQLFFKFLNLVGNLSRFWDLFEWSDWRTIIRLLCLIYIFSGDSVLQYYRRLWLLNDFDFGRWFIIVGVLAGTVLHLIFLLSDLQHLVNQGLGAPLSRRYILLPFLRIEHQRTWLQERFSLLLNPWIFQKPLSVPLFVSHFSILLELLLLQFLSRIYR